MMYDGKLLALARAGLEKDREANRSEESFWRLPAPDWKRIGRQIWPSISAGLTRPTIGFRSWSRLTSLYAPTWQSWCG